MENKNTAGDIFTKLRERYRAKLREKALREEKLIEKISDEYDVFKEHELSRDKEEIYEDALKIYFYYELGSYFTECGEIFEDIISYLSEIDRPLEFLWECYTDLEGYSIETWDSIEGFLTEVRDRYDYIYEDDEERTEAV